MENTNQQNQDLETGASKHITQVSCWGQDEANGSPDDEVVFVDVKEHEKGLVSDDDRSQDLETELLKYKRRCEEFEEECVIWNANRNTLLQELSTDEIIITSLKEQLRTKKKSVLDLELQLTEEKEKFFNSFSEMKQIRGENEQLSESLSKAKQQLSETTVSLAQCQQDLRDLKLSSREEERKIRKDGEQTSQTLKQVQEMHEELKKRTRLMEERLETTLTENSSLIKQNQMFARSLKGLKDRIKVFTHSLQSEDDTPTSPKDEDIHKQVGSSLPQDIEPNTDMNPIQSEPCSTDNNTIRTIPVPREDSLPQMIVKQEMHSPQRAVHDQRTNANKEPQLSDLFASILDQVVPALSDDKATEKKRESPDDGSEHLQDVVTSDLQRGSSSPDIFEAFDLARTQMKFVRARVKELEGAIEISDSLVLREVATREAFQAQLLEIRFDKAKAFQELEDLKLKLLSLESEHSKLKANNKTLKAEKDELQSKTVAIETEINQLKEQVESLKSFQLRSETAERKNYELEKELISVQLNLEQAITTVEASKLALQAEFDRFEQLSTNFNNTKIENQELKTLQDDLEETREKKEQLSVQLEEKERQLESVKTDFNQCSQRLMTAMVLLNGLDISTPSLENESLRSCYTSKAQIWNTVKLKLFAGHCRCLRNRVYELRLKEHQKEFILQKAFTSFRHSMEQQFLAFSSIMRHITNCSISALTQAQNEIQVIYLELGELRTGIHAMKTDLHHYQQKDKALKQTPIIKTQNTGSQCQDFTNSQWYGFLRDLVKIQTPDQPMTVSAVLETIVRVYYRRVMWIKGHSFSDDSIFDAIVSHYTSQKRQIPGLLPMDFITVNSSPVSRLILNALKHSHLLKVQIFKFLLGMEESGLSPRGNTWQFFLKLLFCVFELLGKSLNSILRKWSSLEGVSLPLQCAMDVLANLYNTDNPAGLEISKTSISLLLKDSPVGPGVDFDAFLFLMLQQFEKGECPVDPLQCPRRCTDGSLPNLLNFRPGIIDLRQTLVPSASSSSNALNKSPAKIDIFKTINTLESTNKSQRCVTERQTKAVEKQIPM